MLVGVAKNTRDRHCRVLLTGGCEIKHAYSHGYACFSILQNLDTAVQNSRYTGLGEITAQTIEGKPYAVPYASFESTVRAGGESYAVEFKVTESPWGEKSVHSVDIVKVPETQLRALYDQYVLAQQLGIPFDTIPKLANGSTQGYTGNEALAYLELLKRLNQLDEVAKSGGTAQDYARQMGVPGSTPEGELNSLSLYELKGLFEDVGDSDQAVATDEIIEKAVADWHGIDKDTLHTEGAGDSPTKPYATSRPKYGKTQVDDVWNNYKDPTTGKAPDPAGGSISWNKSKPRQGAMGYGAYSWRKILRYA